MPTLIEELQKRVESIGVGKGIRSLPIVQNVRKRVEEIRSTGRILPEGISCQGQASFPIVENVRQRIKSLRERLIGAGQDQKSVETQPGILYKEEKDRVKSLIL